MGMASLSPSSVSPIVNDPAGMSAMPLGAELFVSSAATR